MKATNSALRQLIEGTKVFAVPLYQRRYSWERDNWVAFWRSILEQYDYSKSEPEGATPITHFIGSVVLAPAPGAASSPTRYVLVDGQQRLTTTMLALAALRDLLAEQAADEASRTAVVAKYNTLYLHNSFETDPLKRLRLLPTQQDRADYHACVGDTPARPNGRLGDAYNFFRSTKAMGGVDLQGNPLDLEAVSEALLSRLTLVDITTESGDNVHRIFQTLNSAGVKLKQVDLLRNHFFMLLPTRGEELYNRVWRDMELRLGEAQLDRFFWAELVRRDARVSRTDVYAAMQRLLEPIAHSEKAVEEELLRFHRDSNDYLAITRPEPATPPAVEARLSFLREWGSETARPLMLELMTRTRAGTMSVEDVAESLLIVESFLVRRMLASIPTNNLNRIFSSLTPVLAKKHFGPTDIAAQLAEGQKYWPSDALVISSLGSRPFYLSGRPHQRRMILERIARMFDGKEPARDGQELTIEHILPQTPDTLWLRDLASDSRLAEQLHAQLLHTVGNLTLTGYNSELGNRPYVEKRERYRSSSLAMNRDLAERYPVWTAEAIVERSKQLAAAVVAIWPGPQESNIDLAKLERAAVEDALLLLPAGAWTSLEDVEQMSGLSTVETERLLELLPQDVRGRVVSTPNGMNHKLRYSAEKLAALLSDSGELE